MYSIASVVVVIVVIIPNACLFVRSSGEVTEYSVCCPSMGPTINFKELCGGGLVGGVIVCRDGTALSLGLIRAPQIFGFISPELSGVIN